MRNKKEEKKSIERTTPVERIWEMMRGNGKVIEQSPLMIDDQNIITTSIWSHMKQGEERGSCCEQDTTSSSCCTKTGS